MQVLRLSALLLNAVLAALFLVFAAISVGPGALNAFAATMAIIGILGASSAVVLWGDGRGQRVPIYLRALATALNVVALIFAAIGWGAAMTGGPGPAELTAAVLPAVFSAIVLLNLALIARRPRSAAVPVGASGTYSGR